jgi:hypothetical protein
LFVILLGNAKSTWSDFHSRPGRGLYNDDLDWFGSLHRWCCSGWIWHFLLLLKLFGLG